MEKKFVKVCPKCGSTNVKEPGSVAYQKAYQLFAECNDCHYSGIDFPEFPAEKVKKAQEEIRKKHSEK